MLRDLFSKRLTHSKNIELSTSLLHFSNVQHSYGKTKSLENIELTINSGEVIFITGPSGAGKTTLLKLIAGELSPKSGKVSKRSYGKIFSALVFQDLKLIEDLSGTDNIKMVYDPNLYGSYRDFQDDFEELTSVFGIKQLVHNRVSEMNGGLKQKIAIIRAFLTKPDIFIADEPTSSLDLDNARRLFDVLNLYNLKRNLTVIWATHNRELVKRFNGRIIHLDKGKIVHSGHACFI